MASARNAGWCVTALALAIPFASCSRSSTKPRDAVTVRPDYDKAGRLTRLASDSDGDGKIDTWGYMDGSSIVRVEADEDGDGQVDRWEYYAPHTSTRGGVNAPTSSDNERAPGQEALVRIERAPAHDARVTRWEYYDHGALARVEEDTNRDGKIDKWEAFSNNSVTSIELDTLGRGTPDRRLVYRPDGTLDRIDNLQPPGTLQVDKR